MGLRTRTVAIAWILGAALVGFFFAGPNLYNNLIGLDASGFWLGGTIQSFFPGMSNAVGGLVLGLGSLALLAILGWIVVWRVANARRGEADPGRRSFLTGAASGAGVFVGSAVAGVAGLSARVLFGVGQPGSGWMSVGGPNAPSGGLGADVVTTHPSWPEPWKGARVQSYRRLGRTGAQVSDISLGSSRIKGEQGELVVRDAIERGVNYIDTAPDYSAEGSEAAIGRAIQGKRDGLFLATKFCTPIGHLPAGSEVKAYKDVVEGSLRRLGTDRVDLIHIHSCDSEERLLDPNVHEAFDRLKEEGKVRFLGFSTHTPNLVNVVNASVDSGRFDVMMVAYHHGIWAPLQSQIERARSEQDMGVVAMKTLKGAKHHGLAGFQDEADAYTQAAFKWVLSNDDLSCLVISFSEPQHVDEYLHASGRSVTPADVAVLEKYDRQIAGTYCSPHCGVCLSACPEGLPIPDVLRQRMYFEDYGDEKEAMRLYAQLGKSAAQCAGCSAPCLGSCPVGVNIPERMQGAHELLTL